MSLARRIANLVFADDLDNEYDDYHDSLMDAAAEYDAQNFGDKD